MQGILRRFQAFFYTSAFFLLDDFAAPAPAPVTMHAPDAGDSAPFSNSFLRLSLFLVGRLRRPRSSAGNVSR